MKRTEMQDAAPVQAANLIIIRTRLAKAAAEPDADGDVKAVTATE
ncbi:hypothetical protein [Streptomyces sp. NBC_00503]|nr:hypothetical protein [Streptomyces sp. NBC_00503]WUD79147.1 hypothetical protein OG490_00250 [Streptomyces sp. NBC_00503]